jgi:hypothetical protein
MNNIVLEKTDKGREEIATRKYKLSFKMRSLLVMIDGNTPVRTLLKSMSAIGLEEKCIAELIDGEFVRNIAIRPDNQA